MDLIAHRGFAAEVPENTLGAVRRATGLADAIEVDARRCGSGEVVVIHDETVDRVTDAEGRVDGLTGEELADLSVLGSGEGVPTLEEVAEAIPAGVGLVLELKETGIVTDALAAVEGVADLIVSSFLPAALEACRAADGEVLLALNVPDGTDRAGGGIDRAVELGCAAVHPHYRLCSVEYVAGAHDTGLAVNAWTVDDRSTARSLAEAGVDGVVADRSDVLG